MLKSALTFFSKKSYHTENSQLIRTTDQFDRSLYDTSLHGKIFLRRLHIIFYKFFYFLEILIIKIFLALPSLRFVIYPIWEVLSHNSALILSTVLFRPYNLSLTYFLRFVVLDVDDKFDKNFSKLSMTSVSERVLPPLMTSFAVTSFLSTSCESCFYFQNSLKNCPQKFSQSFRPRSLNRFPRFWCFRFLTQCFLNVFINILCFLSSC